MTNRHFPRYMDDADFTTNAPSYYEDLARKEKLIRLLAERIWGYEQILDDTLEEIQERFRAWDKNLEDFPDDVKALLEKWLNDGTLDHIINDTIFNWKLDTAIFEQFRDSVTEQLEQNRELIVNAKHFGAIGDGITDDTNALVAALSFIASKGGGTIHLTGDYYVQPNKLNVTKPTKIIGGRLFTKLNDLNGLDTIYIIQAKNTDYFELEDVEIDQFEDVFSDTFDLTIRPNTWAINIENVVKVVFNRIKVKSWAVNPINAHNTNSLHRYILQSKNSTYIFKRANEKWYDSTFLFASYHTVQIDENNSFTSVSNATSPMPNTAIETPSINATIKNNFIDGYLNGMICGSSPLKHKYGVNDHENLSVEENIIKNVRYGVVFYTGVGNNTRPNHFNSGQIKKNVISLYSDSNAKYHLSGNERHAIFGIGTYYEQTDASQIQSIVISENEITHTSNFPMATVPQAILDIQAGISFRGGFKTTNAKILNNKINKTYNGVVIDSQYHTHENIVVEENEFIDTLTPYVFGRVKYLEFGVNVMRTINQMYTHLFKARNGYTNVKLAKPKLLNVLYESYHFWTETESSLNEITHTIDALRFIGKSNLPKIHMETVQNFEKTFFKDDILIRIVDSQVGLIEKMTGTRSSKATATLRDASFNSSQRILLSAIGSLVVGDVVIINGQWAQITAIEGNSIYTSNKIPEFTGSMKLGIPDRYNSPV